MSWALHRLTECFVPKLCGWLDWHSELINLSVFLDERLKVQPQWLMMCEQPREKWAFLLSFIPKTLGIVRAQLCGETWTLNPHEMCFSPHRGRNQHYYYFFHVPSSRYTINILVSPPPKVLSRWVEPLKEPPALGGSWVSCCWDPCGPHHCHSGSPSTGGRSCLWSTHSWGQTGDVWLPGKGYRTVSLGKLSISLYYSEYMAPSYSVHTY